MVIFMNVKCVIRVLNLLATLRGVNLRRVNFVKSPMNIVSDIALLFVYGAYVQ